jgi:predicted transposase YbfD/YdcC
MAPIIDEDAPRARLAVLLQHFAELTDSREPWRVMYPLKEVLLLVTCATIASCDDFDEIAAWGEHNLDFLRRFSEFHHGIPCERWLRHLFNRVDPTLFGRCFDSWVAAQWPDRHAFIAIDGKTSRRTHDQRKGLKALHTLSAYATSARLTLAQLSVPEKTNEITAIPDLLDQLAEKGQLDGALVSIDAIGCQVGIADKIVEYKADYLLALKGNQPNLEAEVAEYFRAAPKNELVAKTTVEKGHGRIETRIYTVSSTVDWIISQRSYPGQPRFTGIKTLVKPSRACRPLHLRHPLLHLLGPARYRPHRPGRPRPLGCRKHALAARRRVWRRPVPISRRPWRKEHGRRPPLRAWSHPRQQRKGKRQDPTKEGKLESRLPARNPPALMTVNLDSVPWGPT